jgi:hypothetical protein
LIMVTTLYLRQSKFEGGVILIVVSKVWSRRFLLYLSWFLLESPLPGKSPFKPVIKLKTYHLFIIDFYPSKKLLRKVYNLFF